jgi:hypothetical protein
MLLSRFGDGLMCPGHHRSASMIPWEHSRLLLSSCQSYSKRALSLTFLPIGSWCKTKTLFEDLSEVALIGKPDLKCDLSKGHIRLFEQELRSLDSLAEDELMWAFSRRLAEETGKVIGTETDLFSHPFQWDVLVEVNLDKVRHPSYLVARQSLLLLLLDQCSCGRIVA